jgi:hypothetical protein
MGPDRMRVLVLALATLVLVLVPAVILDWHVITIIGQDINIDLRTAHVCDPRGVCISAPTQGSYAFFGALTMWGGLAFAALVGYQGGSRVVTGAASEKLSKAGYFIGVGLFVVTLIIGYVYTPDFGVEMPDFFETGRTWAPVLMLLGVLAGCATCYYAITDDDHLMGTRPIVIASARLIKGPPPAAAPVRTPTPVPVDRPKPVSRPITPLPVSQPVPIPAKTPTPSRISQPIPAPLRGKLNYAVMSAEITRAGINARREDGKEVLVLWRDVVGVVARRMPPQYDAVTFVDLVSTAGMTLRLLNWTRMTGEPVEGENEARARALITHVTAQCPNVKLDVLTRKFVDGSPAAQLPDLAKLEAHDSRLA